MTTTVVRVHPEQTVNQVREVLADQETHIADIDSVVIVDADGRLVDDVSLGELLPAEPDTVMADLVGPPWPVTVSAGADVREIADRFIHSRRMSVLVLDDQERPVGRILADDVDEIDAKIDDLTTIRAALVQAVAAGCDDLTVCAGTDCCPIPFTDLAEEDRRAGTCC